jgi:hypothetical protein
MRIFFFSIQGFIGVSRRAYREFEGRMQDK